MTKRESAVDYARTFIGPLCSKPDEMVIEDVLDERGLVLTIKVIPDDMGLLIGRKGIIVNSLRNVLHVWSQRNIASVKLFIEEKK